MYVITKASIYGFEWDRGNLDKNYIKHGVTPTEAEEVFLDKNLMTLEDVKHSQHEQRQIAIGMTTSGKLLFVVYTYRDEVIRVISARQASKKEQNTYEKT